MEYRPRAAWRMKDELSADQKKLKKFIKRQRGDNGKLKYRRVNELPFDNVLKHYRLVKKFIYEKYNITQAELELLFFLYDEHLFTKADFAYYVALFSTYKNYFKIFLERGWIQQFRDYKETRSGKNLYYLAREQRKLITECYKLLYQIKPFPEDGRWNPLFLQEGRSPVDTKYRNFMWEANRRREERIKVHIESGKPGLATLHARQGKKKDPNTPDGRVNNGGKPKKENPSE